MASASSSSTTTMSSAHSTTLAARPRGTRAVYTAALAAAHRDESSLFSLLPTLGPMQMIDAFVSRSFAAVGVVSHEKGSMLSKFGVEGSGDGQFIYPWGICQLPADSLVVPTTPVTACSYSMQIVTFFGSLAHLAVDTHSS